MLRGQLRAGRYPFGARVIFRHGVLVGAGEAIRHDLCRKLPESDMSPRILAEQGSGIFIRLGHLPCFWNALQRCQ